MVRGRLVGSIGIFGALCAILAALGQPSAIAATTHRELATSPGRPAGTNPEFRTYGPLPSLSPGAPVKPAEPAVVHQPSKPIRWVPHFEVPRGGGRMLYLTFDDGPDPTWTPQILALLKRYHVPATFFVIGWEAIEHPALIRAEVAAGAMVENHTEHHPFLTRLSIPKVLSVEVLPVNRVLKHLTGYSPLCLRPPYGDYDAAIGRAAASIGMRIAMWNVDTVDWSRPGTPAIVNSVFSGLGSGAVVLMHDGGGDRSQTVAAVAELLPRLITAGWHFGTLCH